MTFWDQRVPTKKLRKSLKNTTISKRGAVILGHPIIHAEEAQEKVAFYESFARGGFLGLLYRRHAIPACGNHNAVKLTGASGKRSVFYFTWLFKSFT